jgi:redox-sensitive bicupin YhaK (pirin superfamily)
MVGRGLWHSEINNRQDATMRFIQMWFLPSQADLEPAVQQKEVAKSERTNRFLPLVSNDYPEALPIFAPARVFSCFLEAGRSLEYVFEEGHGGYLYVLEGGPLEVAGRRLVALAAAQVRREPAISLRAEGEAELLLVDVRLD